MSKLLNNTAKVFISALRLTKSVFPSSHYALLSLLFIVGLELIFALQRWIAIVSISVVSVVVVGIILARMEEQRKFSFDHIILPIFATTGLTGFAALLATSAVLHIYIVTAGLILFFLLKHGTHQAYPVWNWLITLVVYFLNIGFIMGLRFHVDISLLFALVVIFTVTGLMSWQALRRIASDTDTVLPVLAMAFVHTEVAWVTQFLPSHYSVQTGILTTLYYVLFNLISSSYRRRITHRDLIEFAVIGFAALSIIIFSAKWT